MLLNEALVLDDGGHALLDGRLLVRRLLLLARLLLGRRFVVLACRGTIMLKMVRICGHCWISRMQNARLTGGMREDVAGLLVVVDEELVGLALARLDALLDHGERALHAVQLVVQTARAANKRLAVGLLFGFIS